MVDSKHNSIDLVWIWVEGGLVESLLVLLALLHLLASPALFLCFWDLSLPSLLVGLDWAFLSPALLCWHLLALLSPSLILQPWLILLALLPPSLLILLSRRLSPSLLILLRWWLPPTVFADSLLPLRDVLLSWLCWIWLPPALLILLSLLSPAHKICRLDIIMQK